MFYREMRAYSEKIKMRQIINFEDFLKRTLRILQNLILDSRLDKNGSVPKRTEVRRRILFLLANTLVTRLLLLTVHAENQHGAIDSKTLIFGYNSFTDESLCQIFTG